MEAVMFILLTLAYLIILTLTGVFFAKMAEKYNRKVMLVATAFVATGWYLLYVYLAGML